VEVGEAAYRRVGFAETSTPAAVTGEAPLTSWALAAARSLHRGDAGGAAEAVSCGEELRSRGSLGAGCELTGTFPISPFEPPASAR